MIIGIYKIINIKNGNVYIGESLDIKERWKTHKENLINGTHHSKKLQEDFNTYDKSCFKFKVLEEIDGNLKLVIQKCLLLILENKYIKEYDSINNGYNSENTLALILQGEKSFTTEKSKKSYKIKDINFNKFYCTYNLKTIISLCKKYEFKNEFIKLSDVLRENGFNVITVYQLLRDINILNNENEENKFIINDK